MKLKSLTCKSALSPSRLYGYDYALNPYRGCQHACTYCYAPYVLHEPREWGSFLDLKENISQVLQRELKRKPPGVVGLSTVTDPYQPLEKKYEITRRCLEVLSKSKFPLVIQTKSSLVLRDLDLLKDHGGAEVGITITSFDDTALKVYEPGAPGAGERIQTLEELSSAGVRTWAFLGPIMPYITDREDDLERLIEGLKTSGIEYLMVDRLNLKKGMRPRIMAMVRRGFPELLEAYENIPPDYYTSVKRKVLGLCRDHNLRVEFCF